MPRARLRSRMRRASMPSPFPSRLQRSPSRLAGRLHEGGRVMKRSRGNLGLLLVAFLVASGCGGSEPGGGSDDSGGGGGKGGKGGSGGKGGAGGKGGIGAGKGGSDEPGGEGGSGPGAGGSGPGAGG